jgi:hypothetical protein
VGGPGAIVVGSERGGEGLVRFGQQSLGPFEACPSSQAMTELQRGLGRRRVVGRERGAPDLERLGEERLGLGVRAAAPEDGAQGQRATGDVEAGAVCGRPGQGQRLAEVGLGFARSRRPWSTSRRRHRSSPAGSH